jgi:mRNA interferase RelE/StbE
MEYYFKAHALRQLKKLPKDTQLRIIKKLDFFCLYHNPIEFAESLVRSELGSYRFRIGDYRVIFDLEDDGIIILIIGHRREIYR